MRPCRWLLVHVLAPLLLTCVAAADPEIFLGDVVSSAQSNVSFLTAWNVLGPFRLGTREAVWGADPVEYYGGIRCVGPDDSLDFHSPLTQNATVSWGSRHFDASVGEYQASVDLTVDFPDIDWEFARGVYGWAAFQYQAWLKGQIVNAGDTQQRVILKPRGILELWVNDVHIFGGDFYNFDRAAVVVDLAPGTNDVNVRLIRDVRSMGGLSPPQIQARLDVELASLPVAVVHDSVVLPDVLGGRFGGRYGSVTVRNQATESVILDRITAPVEDRSCVVMSVAINLAPGQSRPIRLALDCLAPVGDAIVFTLAFRGQSGLWEAHETTFGAPLRHTDAASVQKMTFLHPGGAVSYAILKPPPLSNSTSTDAQLSPILNLHGAGVEVDGSLARHMFDGAPELAAWIVSPTGMSPWSSDDWHMWGFADARAAVAAIPDWLNRVRWRGPGATMEKLLVVGHSNGGQGSWYFASHHPDALMGAVAASGYSSIENYVPFFMWTEADPLQTAILHSARSNFRHELLTPNLQGIPIFQQHGSADDNVPPYHSRLMNALLAQAGERAHYSEMLGAGHWFDGAMTTPHMTKFMTHHLNEPTMNHCASTKFTVVIPNSHDMGPKCGICADQLLSPDRMGKVDVVITSSDSGRVQWHLRTENIHRLHVDSAIGGGVRPDEIFLDSMHDPFLTQDHTELGSFQMLDNGVWRHEPHTEWKALDQRHGRQRGALDAIFNTAGPFELVFSSPSTLATALQASRNFLQYFGADSRISPFSEYAEALSQNGTLILFCLGTTVPPAASAGYPILLDAKQLTLTIRDSTSRSLAYASGMGGVWLRPLPGERLELVVWGFDEVGLRQAARLVPTLTGAGQPDFVILRNEARWRGHAGAAAMGFFDYRWRISAGSYLP